MPRITKRQKEAGHPGKPKAKPKSQPRKGFKVGPSHAPTDAYLGKAKKIKADLIERAKVKKQFAKVLRQEGLESTRLGDGSRRRGYREDRSPPKTLKEETTTDLPSDSVPKENSGNPDLRPKGKGKQRAGSREQSSGNHPPNGRQMIDRHRSKGPSKAYIPAEPILPPAPPAPSLRTMKKEAFAKHHIIRSNTGTISRHGQPNMSARMDVLLEKIKRTKA